jgi:hypothetical protein
MMVIFTRNIILPDVVGWVGGTVVEAPVAAVVDCIPVKRR